ncbi:hypothetical protein HYW76_04860 [Candidatus Pacearchaeota archaeon]|nr:hypothetical protein [Candidatus Pacearchaeota archaeon]
MGRKKYIEYISQLFEKSAVVDFASLNRITSHEKKIKQYAKQIVNRLIKQEKIFKIGKGLYSSISESSLAVFGFTPAYLGLQDALSFHNLWEQETNSVIITSKNVRKGIRKIVGVNIIVRRINKKYMFGFEYYKYSLENRDIYLPYSDIEKTFIDMIYFKQPLDEETIINFREKIKRNKLNEYLKKYPKKFRNRVISKLALKK